MSSKTSKRRQKRLNTNEDEDTAEKVDKKSPKKTEEKETITIEEDKEEEVEVAKEENEETNGCKGFENGEKEKVEDEKVEEKSEEKKVDEVEAPKEAENGVESEQNSQAESQKTESEEDIEPLVIVESETETELQFHDSASETQSENDKSPVITSRCMTRRSHTKNVQNGVESKITNDVRVTITRLETETKETKETDEVIEVETTENDESDVEIIDESKLDSTNASIFVNLGNDTTKNFDITVQSVLEDTVTNSFMENTKDMSYGETLRNLTGRRNLRAHDSPFRSRYTKSTLEKDATDSRKSYIPHISSVKRKHQNDPTDEPKRFKVDTESPGLMSYISSPINSFRNKVSRSDIPSSTPKLMSYKYGNPGSNIIDEMSQIDLDEKAESKKWCSIM